MSIIKIKPYVIDSTLDFTFNNVTATGNVASLNANLGNLATSNYFSGNGSLLTSITGANVTGTVSSATTSGTVTTAAQPNITSVGTLSSLTVTGNVTAGNVLTDHLYYANGTAYSLGGGSGTPGGSNTQLQFNDAGSFGGNAGLTFNKTTTTLTANNFIATTTANLGGIGNVTITGGTSGQYLKTDGSGSLSWGTVVGGTSTSVTVDTFTGNGVQTAFTLSTSPASANSTIVNYNGATVLRSAYSVSGTTLTLGSAPANGSKLEVTTFAGVNVGSSSFVSRTYTGDGSNVAYTVTSGTTTTSALVSISGVVQTPTTDYTVSGATLTFTTAPPNGTLIQIRELAAASTTSGVTAARVTGYNLVFGG
jgi:hypothetical protein